MMERKHSLSLWKMWFWQEPLSGILWDVQLHPRLLEGCPELPETYPRVTAVGWGRGRPCGLRATSPSSSSLRLPFLISQTQKCGICGRMWRTPERLSVSWTLWPYSFSSKCLRAMLSPRARTLSPSSGSPSRFPSFIFCGNSTPPQTGTGHLPPPSLKMARVKGPGNPQVHLAEGGASLQFVRLMQSLADRGPESPADCTLHGAPEACRGGSDQAGGGADGGTGGRHFWLPGQEGVAR